MRLGSQRERCEFRLGVEAGENAARPKGSSGPLPKISNDPSIELIDSSNSPNVEHLVAAIRNIDAKWVHLIGARMSRSRPPIDVQQPTGQPGKRHGKVYAIVCFPPNHLLG